MTKEYEYEGEECWFKGHIEITTTKEIDEVGGGRNVSTIKCFVEDKLFGQTFNNILDVDIEKTIYAAERRVKNELKRLADNSSNNSVMDKLRKKGFNSY